MRLDPQQARSRLAAHDHGVLCTLHPERGTDAVPVVFALDDEGFLAVPVDEVKPKSSAVLQRQRNLAADPRATLLVEHWDAADWSRLWWVRAALRFVPDPPPELVTTLAERLAQRYPQYRDRPFRTVLVLQVVELTGWAAAPLTP